MRRVLTVLALVVGGCSSSAAPGRINAPAAPTPIPPAVRPLALIRSGTGIVAVRPGSPVLWALDGAHVSFDATAVVSARASSPSTTDVEAFDVATGTGMGRWTLDGAFTVAAVAPHARWIAAATDATMARGTDIAVIDTKTGVITQRAYTGRAIPEAFSTDGAVLFVLAYQPGTTPPSYRVRSLEVATGEQWDTNDRIKTNAPEDMVGIPLRSVITPDGALLSTLYRKPDDPDDPAFVHVLNLATGWSYCADLPTPFGRAATDSIATSPDGTLVYVAGGGRYAQIDIDAVRTPEDGPVAIAFSDQPPIDARLHSPRGAAWTPSGIIAVTDGEVSMSDASTPLDGDAWLAAVLT